MDFGKKLKNLRTINNMSQQDLADKLDTSSRTISRWELGTNEPDIKYLKELSKIFNVTIDFLVNNSNDIKEFEALKKQGLLLTDLVEDFVIHYLISLDSSKLEMILDKIKKSLDEY